MKPTIFLDIDGVLCTFGEYTRSRTKLWKKYEEARELNIPYLFNPGCVKVLNEILKITDADIVITSDWRGHFSMETLQRIFKYNNVIKLPVDATEIHPTSFIYLERTRAHEIDIYVQKHNIETYVIIDDLALSPYVPKDKFVRTIEREGIKQTNIKHKILKILQYEQK
jgi:HAD domain in Swiss Army Knife RNA repair proteins